MTVRIVTDSTCDLPAAVVSRYGIRVVPLYIHVGNREYLDGIDLSREAFYDQLPSYDHHPTTAVPSASKFHAIYNSLADEGATEVLSIHIASSLSAIASVARVAAGETTAVPVTVFDSRQLSLGTGFLVETAAKMASLGHTVNEIKNALDSQIKRTRVFALLDTLEFLRRSGRMSRFMAGFGSLLQIKPILTVKDGRIEAFEKQLTSKRAMARMRELVYSECPKGNPGAYLALGQGDAQNEARQLAEEFCQQLGLTEVPVYELPPAILTHAGPGVIEISFFVR